MHGIDKVITNRN